MADDEKTKLFRLFKPDYDPASSGSYIGSRTMGNGHTGIFYIIQFQNTMLDMSEPDFYSSGAYEYVQMMEAQKPHGSTTQSGGGRKGRKSRK